MSAAKTPPVKWLCTGGEMFPAMLDALHAAQKSIRLETYIYADGKLGRQILDALIAAAQRGVQVRVLLDDAGSWFLPHNFFHLLAAASAEVHRFNPLHLWRFGVRNHRKLLVCDDRTAFVGGFNISDEYDGDGLTRGWFDIGVRLENPALVETLAASFDELFALTQSHRKLLARWRAFKRRRKSPKNPAGELLLTHPGRGASHFQNALHHDLAAARDVRIISAYFLPTRRLRRDLIRVARRGGRVQLILAGKSDVFVSQLAARSFYPRLLKAGVEVYEYQPQVLHAKMILCDGAAYIGSSNLDIRSLNLNYELMLRLADKTTAAAAGEIFERALKNCRKIELAEWRQSQTFWQRWQSHWAHFLLARIDPFVALRQFRAMKG
jgi:cardiolipin synthase